MSIRVLVCGGRDFTDRETLGLTLSNLHELRGISAIIHGNARGADTLAGQWARANRVQEIAVPAQWSKHGRRAGPIRNQAMLGHGPSQVVAFCGGAGTRDMVKRALAAGVPVMEIVE